MKTDSPHPFLSYHDSREERVSGTPSGGPRVSSWCFPRKERVPDTLSCKKRFYDMRRRELIFAPVRNPIPSAMS